MRNFERLIQSDRIMDEWTCPLARCRSLITPMAAHVERQINMIEEEHHLVQRLQQQFLEINYQPPFATLKVEAEVVTPLTCTPSENEQGNERQRRRKHCTEIHSKRSHSNRFTSPEDETHGEWNRGTRKVPVPEASGVSSLDTEAVSD